MTTEKRLYRSRQALVGGVCAGVAEYFGFDPLVARILTVAFSLATAGLFAVAYVALWVVLPLAPAEGGPVEVEPHSVRSDTYGQVDYGSPRNRVDDAARAAAEVAAARQHLPYDAYAGTGHVPPEPPTAEAAAWAWQARCQTPPPGWQAPGWNSPDWQAAAQAPGGGCPPAPPWQPGPAPSGREGATEPPRPWSPPAAGAADPARSAQPATSSAAAPTASVPSASAAPQVAPGASPQGSGGVKAAVFFGSLLLFCGVAVLLAENIDGVSWWQFWPLVFGIVGIVQMVVPGKPGRRMAQFVDGLMLFCLGGALLPMSLGVVSWTTVPLMFAGLWPLLLIMVGLFVLGAALRAPGWTLAAGLCFALFCIGGLLLYSVPGPNDLIVLTLPFGREFVFPFEMVVTMVR